MTSVSPAIECNICYQTYNNERMPIILTFCGHTFCKSCISIILDKEKKEIICPECKQITKIENNDLSKLAKNRSLFSIVVYQEDQKRKLRPMKSNENREDNINQQEKKLKLEKTFKNYEEILHKLDKAYKDILTENNYINDISEVFYLNEIDSVLDNFITIINTHRENLHKRVKEEFKKVNLIKNFGKSIDFLNKKIDKYKKLLITETENLTNLINNKPSELINDNNINVDLSLNPFQENYLLDLEDEIRYSEFFLITIEKFSKEVYNPCDYFFVNNSQMEKLSKDLKKLLYRACDYDEEIKSHKIHEINLYDTERFDDEFNDICAQSNTEKLKCIFKHFQINPNFLNLDNYFASHNNLYSHLNSFEDKNKLYEFINYLIEEYDYLPLDLEKGYPNDFIRLIENHADFSNNLINKD